MGNQSLLPLTVDYVLYATQQRDHGIGMHVSELARLLRHSNLAPQAFELAIRFADQTKARDRVGLADFAEWLCLDIPTQRKLLAHRRSDVAA